MNEKMHTEEKLLELWQQIITCFCCYRQELLTWYIGTKSLPGPISSHGENLFFIFTQNRTHKRDFHGVSFGIDGIGVDWLTGNVYWTDSEQDWIMISDSSFQHYAVLTRINSRVPSLIAIDPVNRYHYGFLFARTLINWRWSLNPRRGWMGISFLTHTGIVRCDDTWCKAKNNKQNDFCNRFFVVQYVVLCFRSCIGATMSNPNGLLTQKLCHCLIQGRTLNDILMRAAHWMAYLDLRKLNLASANVPKAFES